jgi:hypothetical protein
MARYKYLIERGPFDMVANQLSCFTGYTCLCVVVDESASPRENEKDGRGHLLKDGVSLIEGNASNSSPSRGDEDSVDAADNQDVGRSSGIVALGVRKSFGQCAKLEAIMIARVSEIPLVNIRQMSLSKGEEDKARTRRSLRGTRRRLLLAPFPDPFCKRARPTESRVLSG